MVALLLDKLPLEIFEMIFVYLSANDIIYSFLNISPYMNRIINGYKNYYFDFRNLHKDVYDYILKNLNNQIKCIILSNNISIPKFAHINNFLTVIQPSQFIHVEKLSIMDVDDADLIVILHNLSKFKNLKALKLDCLPSYSGSLFLNRISKLTRLDLPDATFFDNLSAKYLENLKCLSVHNCTFDQLEHLFNICPQTTLRAFALHNGIFSTTTDNQWPQFNQIPNLLKKINLQIDFETVTFCQLTDLLLKLPHLTHIDVKAEGEVDLVDGREWETFLSKTYKNQLISFDFCFTIWSYADMNIDTTLNSFRSPYWLNRLKPWYVAYNGRGLMYTIPRYAMTCSRSDGILKYRTTANDEKLFYNKVTQLMIHNPNNTPKYRFDHVEYLRISDEAYNITNDNILSIVNLINVKHLEICLTIPNKLLNQMKNLYRLSLTNINSLVSSLHKISHKDSFEQVRILNISYNSSDHCYTDMSPQALASLFPNVSHLSIEGLRLRRKYLSRIIDEFQKMYYGKFQIDWDKQFQDNARQYFDRETGRLKSYDDKTNFSFHFDLLYLYLFIWDITQ